MTALEIAQLACDKVRHSDAEALALALRFTRARYQQLFNDHLWKDSLSTYAFVLDPEGDANSPLGSNAAAVALAQEGIYLLPSSVQRVLGVRTAAVGAVPWTAGSRSTLPPNVTWQGHDLSRYWLLGYDAFAAGGTATEFTTHGALVSLSASNEAVTLTAGSDSDAGAVVQVEWTDAVRNERTTSALNLAATSSSVTLGAAREILSVSHAALVGTLTLKIGSDTIATVPAGQTAAALRIPLEVFPKPTLVTTFRVLAKRTPLPLTGQNDQPDIRGVDRPLLDYVTADMREWVGQVQTAQASRAAGDAALMQCLQTEALARPDNPRLVPADGYGDTSWEDTRLGGWL